MKSNLVISVLTAASFVVPATLQAQGSPYFRSAVLFESYDLDPGLGFSRIRQLTIPAGVSFEIARRTSLAVSGGYSVVELTPEGATPVKTSVNGPLDTQLRLSYDAIPGRLIILLNGSAPTGTLVQVNDVSVLGAISSEVIGFSAPTLGAGGEIGGGFVGAVPAGRWAIGFGATFKKSMEYTPIANPTGPTRLMPGAEIRVRGGLEGPLASRTYLRFAGIFAARERDQLNDVTRNGVGNRITTYLALNQGLGVANATIYGFDVFRSDPQIEPSPTGAAILPRGNLFATGLTVDIPLGSTTVLSPNAELRISSQAPDTTSAAKVSKAGQAIRYGAKLRQQLNNAVALVLDGSLLNGYVRRATDINMNGFRAGLHLEVTP